MQQMGDTSFRISIERNAAMPARDFWAEDAEAMELTLAGTRLIVQEVTETLHTLWRRMLRPGAGSPTSGQMQGHRR
jgi:hypothetical protein